MSRDPRRWKTAFGRFVKKTSVAGVVRSLAREGFTVQPVTVYSWVAGHRSPTLKVACALSRVSGGRVSPAAVLQHRCEVVRMEPEHARPTSRL